MRMRFWSLVPPRTSSPDEASPIVFTPDCICTALSINRDTKVVELETIFFGRATKVEVDFSEIDKI